MARGSRKGNDVNQQSLEDILSKGTEGEAIADERAPPFEMPYNGVLLLAVRYLQKGPDTDAVRDAKIDWSPWPTVKNGLPEHWPVMGKGLLLNFFRWDGANIKTK